MKLFCIYRVIPKLGRYLFNLLWMKTFVRGVQKISRFVNGLYHGQTDWNGWVDSSRTGKTPFQEQGQEAPAGQWEDEQATGWS